MKYYILFGPPGAGKGTHAGAIAQKYNLKHISTGELLRAQIAAGTPLGIKAKALIDEGSLVPDEVVEGMIQDVFNSVKDVDGFLLDGYPRTIPQAEVLDEIVAARGETVTGVISIMIPDSEVLAPSLNREGWGGSSLSLSLRLMIGTSFLCASVFYYFFHSAEPSRYIHIGRASPLKLNLKFYLKFFSGERGVVSLLNINFKFNFERSDQNKN